VNRDDGLLRNPDLSIIQRLQISCGVNADWVAVSCAINLSISQPLSTPQVLKERCLVVCWWIGGKGLLIEEM
jgi:hypothetical protein